MLIKNKPERLEGQRYTVQSDIWSLGLSLVELGIGRYPIPVANQKEIDEIFERDPDGLAGRSEGRSIVQSMAIFELLECIVNDVRVSSVYVSYNYRSMCLIFYIICYLSHRQHCQLIDLVQNLLSL